MKIPIPVVIAREGKWFVAFSPALDLATQGRTEKEVKENIADLISDYFKDKDTPKPKINALIEISIASIPVNVPEGVLHSKASCASSA